MRQVLHGHDSHQALLDYREAKRAHKQPVIVSAEPSAQPGICFVFVDLLGHGERSQYGSEHEREDERAGESESVGDGHGREDFPGHALHREQRQECDENDEGLGLLSDPQPEAR